MDFRRIEVIFLIVFLALDIFLFASYAQKGNAVVPSTETSTKSNETVAQSMTADHITTIKLATAKESGYYLASRTQNVLGNQLDQLTGQTMSYSSKNAVLTSQFNTPLTFSKKNRVKLLIAYMQDKDNIIFGDEYDYVAALSDTDSTIVFAQRLKQGLVLDSKGTITFKVSNGVVTGYTQTYLPEITVLRERQVAISARDAVQLLYTSSEISSNSKVIWCKLGYSELTDVRGSVIFIPVWSVMIQHKGTKNKSLKKVNALTKTVVKGTTADGTDTNSSSSSASSATTSVTD